MLRPEFVTTYARPLSSDAFSGWSRADPDRRDEEEGTLKYGV